MRDLIRIVESSYPKVTLRPEFQKWFAGSKVVDKSGNPQVCYHGTFEDFFKFSYHPKNRVVMGFNRLGFWFDTDPRTPGWLSSHDVFDVDSAQAQGSIYPCFLNIKKPFALDSEYLWDEDRERFLAADTKLKEMSKLFYSSKHDHLGNMVNAETGKVQRKNDGSVFNRKDYDNARKEYGDLDKSLRANRSDGFWRLIGSLPNGIKATTEQVAHFQKELMAEGYDGIWLGDTTADFEARDFETTAWWIAFKPEQIKSVFAKEFNPQSSNITESFAFQDNAFSDVDGECAR